MITRPGYNIPTVFHNKKEGFTESYLNLQVRLSRPGIITNKEKYEPYPGVRRRCFTGRP
jgi:hypothetical protein